MTKEEEVLAALDKPRALYSLQQRLDPSNKSTRRPARAADAHAHPGSGQV